MRFTKMHGLGNDYIYIYGPVPANIEQLCRKLSHRQFGIGSDGMIYIEPSEVADFRMRIFNADGSEAKMCGNGIRCVGKYVYDKGLTHKTQLTIETLSGIRHLRLRLADGKVAAVTVDMGKAKLQKMLRLYERDIAAVSVGNPHAVIFVDDIRNAPLTTLGPKLERHPAFPEGVNVEFVQVLRRNALRLRVWERGSGVTMACGTGACAGTVAAVCRGFCDHDTPVSVELDGGVLEIQVAPDDTVTMSGPAATVYEGETV